MRKIVCVVLALSLVVAYGTSGAGALEDPFIYADVDSDNIELSYPSGTVITVTVDGDSFEVTAPPGGMAQLGRWQHGKDLVAGITVTAAATGFTTRELVVADVRVDVVNPDNDSVVVRATGSSAPVVTVWPPASETPSQATAIFDVTSDRWVASFTTGIGYGAWATATVADGDGDQTTAAKGTPHFDMERPGHRMWEAALLYDFSPDTTLCMQVYSSPKAIGKENPPCIDVTTDGTGRAWHEIWDNDHVPLGSAVMMSQSPSPAATLSKTVEVADLEIILVNPTLERVTGTVVAGTAPNAVADIAVGVGSQGQWSQITLLNQSGAWTADFAPFNIGGDAWASARIVDEDGDASSFGRNAPLIIAMPLGGPWGGPSSVQAEDFPPQAELTVGVFEDETATSSRFQGTITAGDNGEGGLGLPVVLQPGNLVRVSDPVLGVTKEIVFAEFAITFVDTVTDTLEGTAPASGDWGEVEVYLPDDWPAGVLNFPPTATWSLELSPYGDVTEQSWIDAAIRDADNDQLYAEKSAPWMEVTVSPAMGWSEWEAAPFKVGAFRSSVPVTFEVFADAAAAAAGTPSFTTTRWTSAAGESYVPHDTFVAGLAPGNVVRATGGGVTFERTVSEFSWALDTTSPADVDPDGSPRYTLSGVAPPASLVSVFAGEPAGGGQICENCLEAPGVIEDPEGSGNWRFAPPPDGFTVGRHTGFAVNVDGTFAGKPSFGVDANPADNTIDVRGALPAESVRVDIAASGGTPVLYSAATTADATGAFTIGSATHGTDIVTDQIVTVTGLQTGWMQRLVMAPFTFDTLDVTGDVLAGTAPAGSEVSVRVDTGAVAEAFGTGADSDGNWSLDLTGRLDLIDGTEGVAGLRPDPFANNFVVLRGPVTAVLTGEAPEPTTVTTDIAGDGATAADPVETTVVVPANTTGTVEIAEEELLPYEPEQWTIIEEEMISAPSTTASDPLTLQFQLDESLLAGQSVDDVAVFQDGEIVGDCTSTTGGIAEPDPCVSSTETTESGDGTITVLTSAASRWSFGFARLVAMPVLTPNPLRAGQDAHLAVNVQSSVVAGEYFVGADPGAGAGIPITLDAGQLTATIDASALPPGTYRVGVRGDDGSAWTPTVDTYLVVYDPAAGTASGSGSIVPGGPTSDIYPADQLLGLDGTASGTFSFTIKYPRNATTPAGSLTFGYGTTFSLASTSMAWLAVDAPTATFEGTAAVNGKPGYTFRVRIVDGSPDRFELQVWAAASDPDNDLPDYQATGNLTRGRIRIR